MKEYIIKKGEYNFDSFIEKYRGEAYVSEMERTYANPFSYLNELKDKLRNADFDDEKKEYLDDAKEAVFQFKNNLLRFLRQPARIRRYKKGRRPPHFIFDIRMYLEYKQICCEYLERTIEPNPHPDIFQDKETFDIFKKWIDVNKDGKKPHKEISFIFQKLMQEDKIRSTNHKVLTNWAYLNKYIDKDTYDFLSIKGGLDSPDKILTKGRTELYNSIIAI